MLVDVADVFGATPILYAARRSATISSLFLAKRGAALHTRDVHNNDILGCALAATLIFDEEGWVLVKRKDYLKKTTPINQFTCTISCKSGFSSKSELLIKMYLSFFVTEN